jgi:hypothetical protein
VFAGKVLAERDSDW